MKKERKRDSTNRERPITFDTVREIARELPGAVESTSYGTPAFKVGKNLFVRQHQDGEISSSSRSTGPALDENEG